VRDSTRSDCLRRLSPDSGDRVGKSIASYTAPPDGGRRLDDFQRQNHRSTTPSARGVRFADFLQPADRPDNRQTVPHPQKLILCPPSTPELFETSEPSTPWEGEAPAEPANPWEGEAPAEPANPSEGEAPAEPANPWEGEAPAEPANPWEGETPAEPANPWEGEAPAEPANPWEGEAPAEPANPWEGEAPAEPRVVTNRSPSFPARIHLTSNQTPPNCSAQRELRPPEGSIPLARQSAAAHRISR